MTKSFIVALSFASMLAAPGCAPQPAAKAPAPREVEVLTIAPATVRDTADYLGTLSSRASIDVYPQVGGYVRRIHVKPGATVAAGDQLVDIDARGENAALLSARADVAAAEARHSLARTNLERAEKLLTEGLAPAQEVDQARAAVAAADAAAQAASAGVALREVRVDFHTVRAAVGGTLGDVLVRIGDAVTPQTQITTIAPDVDGAIGAGRAVDQGAARAAAAVEVTVAIPAERARALGELTTVEVLDAHGATAASAPVFYVAPHADARTQLVDIKAAFPNVTGLRPSELVRVRVIFGSGSALLIPATAVTRQSGTPFVFVVTEQRPGEGAGGPARTVVTRRPVTLGRLGADGFVVERGLSAGDRIAVSSLQMLRDGSPIIPKEAPAAVPQGGAPRDAGAGTDEPDAGQQREGR